MRPLACLALLLVLSGCGSPASRTLDVEPTLASERAPARSSPPNEPTPQSFLNDTFSLELFAYRNPVSYTSFTNSANCVKIDGKQLVDFVGVATWTPTSDFTRNLRVALITDEPVNETVGPSPLVFSFMADLERMAALPRQIGVLLEGEGVAVKQPVTLELSVRSLTVDPPSASRNRCPGE